MIVTEIHEAAWLDEPFPMNHSITWREHFAKKDRQILSQEDQTIEKMHS